MVSPELSESFTLTISCGGIACETVLLMVSTCGHTEALDVGSCIFAGEACQGESCKRSVQGLSVTSGNIHRSIKLVVLLHEKDLSSPAVVGRQPPGCVNYGPSDSSAPELLQAQVPDTDAIWSFSNPQGIFPLGTQFSLP